MVADGKCCFFSKHHCKVIGCVARHSLWGSFGLPRKHAVAKEELNCNANIAFNGKEVNVFCNFVTKLIEQEHLHNYCLILYISTLEKVAILCFLHCVK